MQAESISIVGGEGPSVVGSMLTELLTFTSLLVVLGCPLTQASTGLASSSFLSRLALFLFPVLGLGLKTGL